jgi:hypothetical protein
MYTLLLEYPDNKLHDYCDNITHTAVIDLFVKGIHASQNAHNTIILHNTRDLTLAIAILSNSALYGVKILSK